MKMILQLAAIVVATGACVTHARGVTAGLWGASDAPTCSSPVEIASPLADPRAALAQWAAACGAHSAGTATCEINAKGVGDVWASPHVALAPSDRTKEEYENAGESAMRTPSLMLFLPGTGGTPVQYSRVLRAAAAAGHHTLGLSFMSRPVADDATNAHCALLGDAADACMARLHETAVFGRRARPFLPGQGTEAEARADALWAVPAELAVDRVAAAAVVAAGWQNLFLDAAGALRWRRVVVAGHSQGAGHAAYMSARLGVRAVLFGGPQDEAFGWASVDDGSRNETITRSSSTRRPRRVALIHEHEQFGARPVQREGRVLPGLLERNLALLGLRGPCERDSAPLRAGCDIVVSNKGSHCRSLRGLHAGLAYDRCSPRSMERVWASLFDAVR